MGSLQVAYRLPTGSGVTISQPQPRAAALQDSDLYVEVDKLDSYTHILPELTRLFAKGAVQPQLAQFLIALTLTMVRLFAFLLLMSGLVSSPHYYWPLCLPVADGLLSEENLLLTVSFAFLLLLAGLVCSIICGTASADAQLLRLSERRPLAGFCLLCSSACTPRCPCWLLSVKAAMPLYYRDWGKLYFRAGPQQLLHRC